MFCNPECFFFFSDDLGCLSTRENKDIIIFRIHLFQGLIDLYFIAMLSFYFFLFYSQLLILKFPYFVEYFSVSHNPGKPCNLICGKRVKKLLIGAILWLMYIETYITWYRKGLKFFVIF